MANPGYHERQRMQALLPTLTAQQRAAFAAICAERILPLILHFFNGPKRCGDAINLAWRFATGNAPSKSDVAEVLEACESLINELYESDDAGYPMYAVKSALSAAASVSGRPNAAEDAAFNAQDASIGTDVDSEDEHVQEEVDWQMKALETVLSTPTPTRDMFKHLPSNPRWLQMFHQEH